MKRSLITAIVICMVAGLAVTGCGTRKASTGKEAIKIAGTMDTKEKQEEYLEKQARMFFEDKEFQQAVEISQYVLTDLNEGSEGAKRLIAKAQNAMAVQAAAGTGAPEKTVPGGKQ